MVNKKCLTNNKVTTCIPCYSLMCNKIVWLYFDTELNISIWSNESKSRAQYSVQSLLWWIQWKGELKLWTILWLWFQFYNYDVNIMVMMSILWLWYQYYGYDVLVVWSAMFEHVKHMLFQHLDSTLWQLCCIYSWAILCSHHVFIRYKWPNSWNYHIQFMHKSKRI